MMIYIIAFIIAVVGTGFTVYQLAKISHKKQMDAIEVQLRAFLRDDNSIVGFSTEDNIYSNLRNYIVELEEKLLLQKDLLEKKTNETAEFIANISHQLKTPLAGIKLYCEMDHAPHCDKQLALIEHMEHHIKSLLTLEKFRVDAYVLEFQQHDLKELLEETWEELNPIYGKIEMTVSGNEALRCDRYWLSEAFLNVFKNSIEHMQGSGEIRINIFKQQSAIFVEIDDNGGGIKEGDIERIFARFSRLSKSDQSGGVGLGLAITRMITEKHHGTVIASNTSIGLRLTFCFPIVSGHLTIM